LTVAILYIGVEHDPLLGDSAENLLYRSQGAQGKNCIIQKIVLALALACAPMLGAAGTPALADRRIVFDPSKACHATDMSAYVSGTLTGDGVPNNSMSVTCEKAGTMNDWPGKCVVVRARQIGDNQIGRIHAPEVYPIARWSDYEIVATDDPESLHRCRITIISINRKTESVTWIEQPNPQADPVDCKDADTERFRWTIEGWRR
jgi:hypothetical protein